MKWPTIAAMSVMAPLPDGYRYEKLSRAGIPVLIDTPTAKRLFELLFPIA